MGFLQGDQVGYLRGVAGYTVYIMAENESQHTAFDMSEGQLIIPITTSDFASS